MGSFSYSYLSVSLSLHSYSLFMIGVILSLTLLEALSLLSEPVDSPPLLLSFYSLLISSSVLMSSLSVMLGRSSTEVVIYVRFSTVI